MTKAPVFVNIPDLAANEMKIEFETKSAVQEKPKEEKQETDEEKESLNKNNVYLQERPDIDIFKAIFDEDEDEDVKENKKTEEEVLIESDNEMNTSDSKIFFYLEVMHFLIITLGFRRKCRRT